MRLGALDGLRGVAAILVVVVHLALANSVFLESWVQNSYSLLSVFFLFSGFVMAMMYGDSLHDRRDAGRFAIKRFGRLWPLHAAMLLLMFSFEIFRAAMNALGIMHSANQPFTGATSLPALAENFFLVQAWGWQKPLTWNFPAWTLSTEIIAYAILCAIALMTRSLRVRVALAAFAAMLALILHADQTHFWSELEGPSIARCVMDFFVGFIVYYIWKVRPITSPILATILEAGTVVVAFLLAVMGARGLLFLSNTFVFALMVYTFASNKGLLARLMETRLMKWLGSVSLAVYLVHAPILLIFAAGLSFIGNVTGWQLYEQVTLRNGDVMDLVSFGGPLVMDALSLALLAFIIFAAWLAHIFVETPARAYFAGLANRAFGRTAAAPEPA